jgi:phosphoribosylformimino-5-aminoimidazole carboxamide ribotide isomerase
MKIEIIPAIDIIEGKCVRLTQGDYSQKKIYNEQPAEVAMQFEDAGLKRLHLVDLDGARLRTVRNWKILEEIAGRTNLTIDFGGGIQTDKDLQIVYNSGAMMATIGSLAVKEEELFTYWLSLYGPNSFLLGADVKEEKIAIHGWQETTDIAVYDFLAKYTQKKLKDIFCTDVSKDGLLEGPAIELYEKIISQFPNMHLIASGGVRSVEDINALKSIGCKGVIVGKAIYEGRITLKQLSKYV